MTTSEKVIPHPAVVSLIEGVLRDLSRVQEQRETAVLSRMHHECEHGTSRAGSKRGVVRRIAERFEAGSRQVLLQYKLEVGRIVRPEDWDVAA